MEETCVPEPARARDEGVVAAAMALTAPENLAPFVELPQSSGEYEGSGEVNPVAAASAVDKITEFMSPSEEVFGTGMSEGPRHGAIIQSGAPLEFLHSEQEEEAVWKA